MCGSTIAILIGMMHTPNAGDMLQDRIGHWYRVLEVKASGWQFICDAIYEMNGKFYSYGYAPVRMGRSELRID